MNENGEITEAQKAFIDCHNDIVYNGRAAYDFAYKMAVDIKRMRDEKLYVAGGYETFGEYTEKALGMKERNAYNYIQVVETYSEEYLQSNAKIGVTKLLLLAALPESDRERLEAEVESLTVKELKGQIEALKREKGEQASIFEDEKKKAIKEVEGKAAKEIKELTKKKNELSVEIEKIQKELKIAKETPAEVKVVDNAADKEEINRLTKLLEEKEREKAVAEKKLEIAKDDNMTKFSILFEDIQEVCGKIAACLNRITNTEDRSKCKKALASVLGGLIHE